MLTPVELHGEVVQVDVEATRAAYANRQSQVCDCTHCQNVRAQFDEILTSDVLRALQSLGIDPRMPVEITDYGREDTGRIVDIEWAFLGDPATIRDFNQRPAGLTIYSQGAPDPAFPSDTRCSIGLLLNNVQWVLAHPEPK